MKLFGSITKYVLWLSSFNLLLIEYYVVSINITSLFSYVAITIVIDVGPYSYVQIVSKVLFLSEYVV